MKLKTNLVWDLRDIYTSIDDPKIEQDVVEIEKGCLSFNKKYSKDSKYLENNSDLLKSLKDYEQLSRIISSTKPLWYLYNMKAIESSNSKIDAKIGLFEPRVTKALNNTLFYTISLGKLSQERVTSIIKDQALSKYHYTLKVIFDNAKYDLSEDAERVLSLMHRPASSMWRDSFSKLLNEQEVVFKGKKIPINEALSLIHQLGTQDRRKLDILMKKKFSEIVYVAEQEINAVYTTKKIIDELRGYKKPYEASILGYENSVESIENLAETVTKNFSISHRFYKLKKKLLKLPHLTYADRAVGVSKVQKEISFEEACKILKGAFGEVDYEYVEILEMMLKNKKIDVPSRKGKKGGAYCWGGFGVPTLVLLNYVPSIDAVLTFAHEMGHAIHTELANRQDVLNSHYTTSVAEVASTFFENLAFKKIYDASSDKDKFYLLYDRVADSIQTVFRQIACFNFEKDLHAEIRQNGIISAKKIKELHNKNMKAYLGPVFKMEEDDGYFFEAWSHIRRFFYVYSYAYGEIISKALYKKCEENPEYFKTMKQFMILGRSMSPDDIFKSVGLDTTQNSFFEIALKAIEEDISKLEKLAKKL